MKKITLIALLSLSLASASPTRVFEVDGLQYVNLWDFTFNNNGSIGTGFDKELYWTATFGNRAVIFTDKSNVAFADGASIALTQPVKNLSNMPYIFMDDVQKIFGKSILEPRVTPYQSTFLIGSAANASMTTQKASGPVSTRICKPVQVIRDKITYNARLSDTDLFVVDINNSTNEVITLDWGNTLFTSPTNLSYSIVDVMGLSRSYGRIAPKAKFTASLSKEMLVSPQSEADPFDYTSGKGSLTLYLFTSLGRVDLQVDCETKVK